MGVFLCPHTLPLMVYNVAMQPKYYGAAATYNKPGSGGLGSLLKIIGIVVGVIVLLSLAFLGYNILTSGGKNTAAQLVARERQLITFMTTNQSSIKTDSFLTINSNGVSLVTSDHYALLQGLKTNYGLTAVPEEIAKSEVDSTSAKTLSTAKIQSRFDKVYLQLLRDKIAATQQLARSVLGSASGSLKTATENSIKNLTTIDEQLAKLVLP
jgi:hypothetical protein